MKSFFSASELAEIARDRSVRGFPATKRGVVLLAGREGWNDLPNTLCRPRRGKVGGGVEYHVSLLPEPMQSAISGEAQRAALVSAQERQRAAEKRKLDALDTLSLSGRQRAVMEARAQVLLAIMRYQTVRGGTRAGAVRDFEAAQAAFSGWIGDPAGFGLTPETLRIANDRARGDGTISARTMQRWFKAQGEAGIAGLAPATTKDAEAIPPAFAEFLKYYAVPAKPPVTEALEAFHADHPEAAQTLSLDQVRRILRVKLNDIERNVGREGLLTLRSRMPYVQRSTDNLWPTTIYIADGKTFDAEIADPTSGRPMRPEITSILDVATRKCVGFAISRKENTPAVTEALRNACIDFGIPAIFYTDRGAGYKNALIDGDEAATAGLMGRLSITKMHALPYNSQAKGIVERFNGTVWNKLARSFPTFIGAEMDKEAKQAVFRQTRREIAEVGASASLPTWEEFRARCERAIAAYNDRPHSSLPKITDPETGKRREMSPNEAWAAHVAAGFEPVPVAEDERDDLFRPYVRRKVSRAIVEWNSNKYFHRDLERYHGEEVLVGYDDAQARYVWVREFDRSDATPGRLICVADFTGGKVDYVARTAQAAAEERRAKGRLKRLDVKREAIEAERIAPLTIEAVPLHPVEFLTQTAPVSDAVPVRAAPKGPRFSSDTELAVWALDHPDDLTANQLWVLRDCLSRDTTTELFRMSGIDLPALRALVRRAAAA